MRLRKRSFCLETLLESFEKDNFASKGTKLVMSVWGGYIGIVDKKLLEKIETFTDKTSPNHCEKVQVLPHLPHRTSQ